MGKLRNPKSSPCHPSTGGSNNSKSISRCWVQQRAETWRIWMCRCRVVHFTPWWPTSPRLKDFLWHCFIRANVDLKWLLVDFVLRRYFLSYATFNSKIRLGDCMADPVCCCALNEAFIREGCLEDGQRGGELCLVSLAPDPGAASTHQLHAVLEPGHSGQRRPTHSDY